MDNIYALSNVFTPGTEGLSGPDGQQLRIPINEDWCFLGVVDNISAGIVSLSKLWDDSGYIFFAELAWEGRPQATDPPPDNSFQPDDIVRVFRRGEGNSPDGLDFVVLVPSGEKLIFVQDLGENLGRQIEYDSGGNIYVPVGSQTLESMPADPLSFFHDSTSPFAAGRIYAGVLKSGKYIVFVPGIGGGTKVFAPSAGGATWTLTTDGAGAVVSFTAS